MFCYDLNPRVIPSAAAEFWAWILKFVSVGHVATAVLYFISGTTGIVSGVMELLAGWTLFIAFRTFDCCAVTIYIWLVLFNLLNCTVVIGMSVQFSDKVFNDKQEYTMAVYLEVVVCIAAALYCFALYVAYRAYKEFKALVLEARVEEDALIEPQDS